MYIKKGSKETELVKKIQAVVGVPADGDFGPMTEKAVIVWQRSKNLVADGVVGPKTLEAMEIIDTDLSEQALKLDNGLVIERHYLPPGEYLEGPINKDYCFLHHTAGWDNPFRVIDAWGRDTRGRVATEFVMGGQKITDNTDTYDGTVVQCFPEGCAGWHLGTTGSGYMHKHSVGIEICNFGYLTNGKTYVGTPAHEDQICTIEEPFRGKTQWHKYSDKQLKSTEKLLEYIAERDNIDLRTGLPEWIRKHGPIKAFEFNEDAYNGKVKGLLTHTNVRKDKTDLFPQPELIDMLLSL